MRSNTWWILQISATKIEVKQNHNRLHLRWLFWELKFFEPWADQLTVSNLNWDPYCLLPVSSIWSICHEEVIMLFVGEQLPFQSEKIIYHQNYFWLVDWRQFNGYLYTPCRDNSENRHLHCFSSRQSHIINCGNILFSSSHICFSLVAQNKLTGWSLWHSRFGIHHRISLLSN